MLLWHNVQSKFAHKLASELSIDKNSISEYQTLGDDDNPIVLRLFLTSSRNYKHEKMQLCDKFKYLKAILFDLPLPRFIWVCECFQISEYLKFGKVQFTRDYTG